MAQQKLCSELASLSDIKQPQALVCDECIKTGSSWVHLRTCQECGGTHCCDSSPNKHATKHFHRTQHPVMASAEPGERWVWCYVHEEMAEY
ncbi:UBP-type zinc finger domain-containing protein [Fibrella sp. HMF5335]|uniref:UBP-type zinc finger domain-containing protein n=1 Tax=Fibrella rubiginis TaxID=2817060 RepID=A0A939GF46_9BACT|nr:UBP-type zinc finger domain-containing protein [Fibrella rubiginis]MBO0937186.1 UBP-type zinc finger domain-containing protein [Fibrella rubiginis]